MTLDDKNKRVTDSRIFFKCLRKGHLSRTCTVSMKCQVCGGRHYAVLCRGNDTKGSSERPSQNNSETKPVSTSNPSIANISYTDEDSLVLMKSVRMYAKL